MQHDISNVSGVSSVFDLKSQKINFSEDIIVEEIAVRKLGDMRSLFINPDDYLDEQPLYYMYNGIYNKEHESLIRDWGIRYEYTVLMNNPINNECIKSYGHIHAINPLKMKRHDEAYEILCGKGIFQLFKIANNSLNIILLETNVGDRFTIPSDYYHLSINVGSEPFIFGDLLLKGSENDYSYLQEMKGAPLYCCFNHGNIMYKFNNNYKFDNKEISFLKVSDLPPENQLAPIPLYTHFVSRPDYFEFLR